MLYYLISSFYQCNNQLQGSLTYDEVPTLPQVVYAGSPYLRGYTTATHACRVQVLDMLGGEPALQFSKIKPTFVF